jgi:hypothetical protein
MDPLSYLTTFSADFGPLEWVFFIAQVVVAAAGAYLVFMRADPHPVRGGAIRQLGYALLAVGAIGTLLGVLRLAGVQVFTMPIWFTIVTVVEVVLAIYALYYAMSVYPVRLAAYEEANRARSNRRSSARPQPAVETNGTHGIYTVPKPASMPSRRDARRDRKRKSR